MRVRKLIMIAFLVHFCTLALATGCSKERETVSTQVANAKQQPEKRPAETQAEPPAATAPEPQKPSAASEKQPAVSKKPEYPEWLQEMLADKHRSVDIEKVIQDAVAGEGEAASLSPEQVVRLLAEYHDLFGPRWDREVRAWWELADKVTKKYPKAIQQAILAGTKSRDEFTRSLGRVGGQENISFLSQLAEKSPSRWVARALGRTKSKDAWPALRKLLDHKNFTIAAVAMEELTHAGDREIIPTMREWLESGDENKREAALGNCQRLGVPALLPALNRIDSVVTGEKRAALYLAFAHCGDGRYLDEIHKQAQDESAYKASLEKLPPDPAERIVSWNYRQNKALSAIAKLGNSRSLPVLDKLSKEASDPKIRGRATRIANDIRKKTNQR